MGSVTEFVVMLNRPIVDVFTRAASPELDVIADIITDKGEGRLALSSISKNTILEHKKRSVLQSIGKLLAREICCYGGIPLINVFRSDGADYLEVAKDVAKHLGAKNLKHETAYGVEEKIIDCAIRNFAITSKKKATNENRLDFLDIIIRGLVYPDHGLVERILKNPFLGGGTAPILDVISLPSLLSNEIIALTSPHRITVPAVMQIASMRRRQIAAEHYYYRRSLEACL